MSAVESADEVCACCGKAEVDNIKLRRCTACNLVKYCSVDCQKNHRPQHKKACKKRMAEIRDDKLFTQPDESHRGECPLCCIPLSLDHDKSTLFGCCSKFVCNGCRHADELRQLEQGLDERCPFCREPKPKTAEEARRNLMERVKANDPIALCQVGNYSCYDEEDYEKAFKYWTKAAESGDIDAHYRLSFLYQKGDGVEKDKKKEIYHLEEAAIGGHHLARHSLGCYEVNSVRFKRGAKHFTIAAKLGYDKALEEVKRGYRYGNVSKDDLEAALRGHQAAVDATKSKQRDEADVFYASEPRSHHFF